MLLIHIKRNKAGFNIDVQNGDKQKDVPTSGAWRSRELTKGEMEFYLKDAVTLMFGSAALEHPLMNTAIPDANAISDLRNGIGLSDDHKSMIKVKHGVVEVLQTGARWEIVSYFSAYLGHIVMREGHINGEF